MTARNLIALLMVKEEYSHERIMTIVSFEDIQFLLSEGFIERDYEKELGVFENSYYYKICESVTEFVK